MTSHGQHNELDPDSCAPALLKLLEAKAGHSVPEARATCLKVLVRAEKLCLLAMVEALKDRVQWMEAKTESLQAILKAMEKS